MKNIFLVSIISFFIVPTKGQASPSSIIKIFNEAMELKVKYKKNPKMYSSELFEFHDDKFVPAVDEMLVELGKGSCKQCLVPYLKALSYMEDSASEEIPEQLLKVITNHPKDLNKACSEISAIDKKSLSIQFSESKRIYTHEKKVLELNKLVPKCF